jgi:hypothetical protein
MTRQVLLIMESSFTVACVIVHRALSGGVAGQTCGVLVEGLPSVLSVVFNKDPAQRFLEPSRRGKPPGAAFEVTASPILAATGSVRLFESTSVLSPVRALASRRVASTGAATEGLPFTALLSLFSHDFGGHTVSAKHLLANVCQQTTEQAMHGLCGKR